MNKKVQSFHFRRNVKPKTGLVHLGIGAFFRAHAAIYIQQAQSKHDSSSDWGVVGISLRSSKVRDRMMPQNYLYHAVEASENGLKAQVIDSVTDVLVAPENPQAVLDIMTSEDVKIVSLTITEKGYCRGVGDALDLDHPDIQHDLSNKDPRSAIGFIVRALDIRRKNNLRPFTVMSLDNLNSNGYLTRQVVAELASQIDPELAQWIERECRFPSTMVDRIVPATTAEMVERLNTENNIHDPAMVVHEPFRQWVIEDSFVDNDRPDFGAVGAELVADVEAFEHMKLRLLNGSHSALAYIGSLIGHLTVSDAINDPRVADFISDMWQDEIIPSLQAPPNTDLETYASTLLKRYRNSEIHHLLEQIAMDGSQKMPQRILNTLFENIHASRPHRNLLTVIAAWFRFLQNCACSEKIDDPLAAEITKAIDDAKNDQQLVSNLLAISTVFSSYSVEAIKHDLVEIMSELNEMFPGKKEGPIA